MSSTGVPHIKCAICSRLVPMLDGFTIAGNSCALVWCSAGKVVNACRECMQYMNSDFAAQYNEAVRDARGQRDA